MNSERSLVVGVDCRVIAATKRCGLDSFEESVRDFEQSVDPEFARRLYSEANLSCTNAGRGNDGPATAKLYDMVSLIGKMAASLDLSMTARWDAALLQEKWKQFKGDEFGWPILRPDLWEF
jgi:hypothetical protein